MEKSEYKTSADLAHPGRSNPRRLHRLEAKVDRLTDAVSSLASSGHAFTALRKDDLLYAIPVTLGLQTAPRA